MKSRHLLIVLLIAATVSMLCVRALYLEHRYRPQEEISRLVYLPSPILRAVSLEFKGAASDYLMLKIMTYLGEQLDKQADLKHLTPEDWQKVHRALVQVTNLDPRFWDPYLVAETSLPWDAGMVEETNTLLLKAADMRTDDFHPYYFLWFNAYYFQKDMSSAFKYLKKAAGKPGAPGYFASLTARMGLYSGNTYSGVLFLEEMIKEINDPATRALLVKRHEALSKIVLMERKVNEYKKKFGADPKQLEDLVRTRLLDAIPEDPYGGRFYLMKNGRVYTTSKLASPKKLK